MKPAPFKYYSPDTLEQALGLMAEHGYDAKALAGGQNLIPTMNFRLAQPAVMVDLNKIQDLFYIKEQKKELRIGAMTRKAQVERSEQVKKYSPLVYQTMPFIAHPQIRNRGTMGGSIAHADPASELPAVMLALNARFRAAKKGAERWIEAKDFFTGFFATALEPEELLLEIALPFPAGRSGFSFKELSRRKGDYALVGVAVALEFDRKSRCTKANIIFLSVGDGPIRASQAENLLLGQPPSDELISETAQTAATKDIEPGGDIHATVEYRRQLAKTLTNQALHEAFAQAGK